MSKTLTNLYPNNIILGIMWKSDLQWYKENNNNNKNVYLVEYKGKHREIKVKF